MTSLEILNTKFKELSGDFLTAHQKKDESKCDEIVEKQYALIQQTKKLWTASKNKLKP